MLEGPGRKRKRAEQRQDFSQKKSVEKKTKGLNALSALFGKTRVDRTADGDWTLEPLESSFPLRLQTGGPQKLHLTAF